MKSLIIILFLVTNSIAWADAKIGFVNIEEIIPHLKIYRPIDEKINLLINKRNEELNVIKKKITDKEKSINSGILNKVGVKKVKEELIFLYEQKEEFIKKAQLEVDTKEQQLRYPILKQVILTIKNIHENEKYDMIIDNHTTILFNKTKIIDLNNQVIKIMNK